MKIWTECTKKEKIERWQRAIQTLEGLSPHAKKNHFDIGSWAVKTTCGTVACIAGHCGMSPWFRKRGLKFKTLRRLEESIGASFGNDVLLFFGFQGYRSIFTNMDLTTVNKAVKEMKRYVRYLQLIPGNMNMETERNSYWDHGGRDWKTTAPRARIYQGLES